MYLFEDCRRKTRKKRVWERLTKATALASYNLLSPTPLNLILNIMAETAAVVNKYFF